MGSKYYDDDGVILEEGRRLLSKIQDPAPLEPLSETATRRREAIQDSIMERFQSMIPSNYVAQVGGPFYLELFRAFAYQLADFQMSAELISDDTDWSLTRPDLLYQVFGWAVFPGVGRRGRFAPEIESDITLRDFLRRMTLLLLEGARTDTIRTGAGLLSELGVDVVEKAAHLSKPTSDWTWENQYEFEVNMVAFKETLEDSSDHWHRIRVDGQGHGRTYGTYSEDGQHYPHQHDIVDWEIQDWSGEDGLGHSHGAYQGFPAEPFVLKQNIELILAALKPAHTVYTYRHLFVDMFDGVFEAEPRFEIEPYYYHDLRRNWRGAKSIKGSGDTGTDRAYLIDAARDFSEVAYGSPIEILTGANAGRYTVRSVEGLVVDDDPVARPYIMSPSGLEGEAVVVEGEVVDPSTDLSAITSNETISFSEGPNIGSYRVSVVLGSGGGRPGIAPGPASRVRVAKSRLRLMPRMAHLVVGQEYELEMDRLGMSEPTTAQEDVSNQFLL